MRTVRAERPVCLRERMAKLLPTGSLRYSVGFLLCQGLSTGHPGPLIALEHDVFRDRQDALIEHRPHLMSQPVVRFCAAPRVGDQFNAKSDFCNRYRTGEEAIERLRREMGGPAAAFSAILNLEHFAGFFGI
jgi:hypothetical protein